MVHQFDDDVDDDDESVRGPVNSSGDHADSLAPSDANHNTDETSFDKLYRNQDSGEKSAHDKYRSDSN